MKKQPWDCNLYSTVKADRRANFTLKFISMLLLAKFTWSVFIQQKMPWFCKQTSLKMVCRLYVDLFVISFKIYMLVTRCLYSFLVVSKGLVFKANLMAWNGSLYVDELSSLPPV